MDVALGMGMGMGRRMTMTMTMTQKGELGVIVGIRARKESLEGREKGRATDWQNKRTKMENQS